jgi:hypothetical protein
LYDFTGQAVLRAVDIGSARFGMVVSRNGSANRPRKGRLLLDKQHDRWQIVADDLPNATAF